MIVQPTVRSCWRMNLLFFASRRIDKLQFLCTRRLLNSVQSYGIKLKKKYQTRTQNISYSLSLAGWPFIERCDTPSSFLVSTHDPQQKRRESRNSPVGFKVTQSRDLYILLWIKLAGRRRRAGGCGNNSKTRVHFLIETQQFTTSVPSKPHLTLCVYYSTLENQNEISRQTHAKSIRIDPCCRQFFFLLFV